MAEQHIDKPILMPRSAAGWRCRIFLGRATLQQELAISLAAPDLTLVLAQQAKRLLRPRAAGTLRDCTFYLLIGSGSEAAPGQEGMVCCPHICRNSLGFQRMGRLSEQFDHPFHTPIG
jgi:hypothetical protein